MSWVLFVFIYFVLFVASFYWGYDLDGLIRLLTNLSPTQFKYEVLNLNPTQFHFLKLWLNLDCSS